MLMHTVNYLRVVGCEHDAAMRAEKMKATRKTTKATKNNLTIHYK